MIQAIIFDCFGVLLTENWLQFKREKFGHDPDKLAQVTELNHMVDAGLMNDNEYIATIAALADMHPQEVRQVFRGVSPNKSVIEPLPKLKQQYKLGMLSNISGDWFEQLLAPEVLALFDALTLSYQTGFTKPDPRAYHVAAEQLGVPCEQCVFVDDVEQNITAAKDQGMQAILFDSADAVVKRLAGIK